MKGNDMKKMRAKLAVTGVEEFGNQAPGEAFVKTSEQLHFAAVGKSEGYPADGSDEDNTYAKWTPDAKFSMTVTNPALFGQHQVGQKYYVDFTLADDVKAVPGPHEPPRPAGSNPVA
jgi:hypothetical protein